MLRLNNEIRSILNNNDKLKKITIKNKALIIDTNNGSFVIKKRNNFLDKTYNYLKSRAFDYFPNKQAETNEYDIYEYIEDITEPNEQKAFDLIHLLAVLHSKTTFYKEIDIDKYKEIYEDLEQRINYLFNYYTDIINMIEKNVYMSPSNYLLARNINKIFLSLNYCQKELESWYELIQDKRKVRVVNIHNNLSIDHYIKKDKPYFISWDKSKIDMPIYDLLTFYQRHYLDYNFSELLKSYEKIYPLTTEEKKLLFIFMALPFKEEFKGTNYSQCVSIRRLIDYIYITEEIITEFTTTNTQK